MKYPAFIYKEKDGIFLEFPDLPGCLTDADTIEDILIYGNEALTGYLESLIERDKEIPKPSMLTGENIIWFEVPPKLNVSIQIREERKRQGLSQKDLAKKMKGSFRTIQQVERLKSSPTLRTLGHIARALGKRLKVELE